MELYIDMRSGAPIYEQIYRQIKEQIRTGALAEDEPLPSIRGLASDLRVSVITTKRAYDELERDGLIYTVAGKGSFAARLDPGLLREENRRSIENHMREIQALAAQCGMEREELAEMYRAIEEEKK